MDANVVNEERKYTTDLSVFYQGFSVWKNVHSSSKIYSKYSIPLFLYIFYILE